MNVVREIQKLNDLELKKGIPLSASWHAQYLKSPWVFVGSLPYELTEGDVICVMSQVPRPNLLVVLLALPASGSLAPPAPGVQPM